MMIYQLTKKNKTVEHKHKNYLKTESDELEDGKLFASSPTAKKHKKVIIFKSKK